MNDAFDSIALVFLGVSLTTLAAIWHHRKRDREAREHAAFTAKEGHKRNFQAGISSVRGSFDAHFTPDDRLVDKHQESIPRVRDQCAVILNDIADSQRASFETTRDTYLGLTREDIECCDPNEKPPIDPRGNYICAVGWKPRCHHELGRARIQKLLDTLCSLAD